MLDALGREIRVGDYIVYLPNTRNVVKFLFGRVVALSLTQRDSWTDEMKTYSGVIVHGVREWFGTVRLNRKSGLLGSPDRCIVVDSIPKEYKELLDTVEVKDDNDN